MTYVEVINIIILIGRDESESSSPEQSLAFGAVWAVVSFVLPARFCDGLFGGISQVNQLEVVQGTLNRDRPVSIRGGSYYSVSDRSIFVLTRTYIVANRRVSVVESS
jgi:hypothetical protein